MRIKEGYGFWNVTKYPYGGDFGRAGADTRITEIIGPAGKQPKFESKVRLLNGDTVVVLNEYIEQVGD